MNLFITEKHTRTHTNTHIHTHIHTHTHTHIKNRKKSQIIKMSLCSKLPPIRTQLYNTIMH